MGKMKELLEKPAEITTDDLGLPTVDEAEPLVHAIMELFDANHMAPSKSLTILHTVGAIILGQRVSDDCADKYMRYAESFFAQR